MNDKINLLILSSRWAGARQLTVSRGFLFFLCLIFFLSTAALSWGVYDYAQLKQQAFHTRDLHSRIRYQEDTIALQRRQIQSFAQQINDLKTQMVALRGFEKQVRIIANLNDKSQTDPLFGIGGTVPEDLATGLDLARKHNSLMREMHEQTELLKLSVAVQKEGFDALLRDLGKKRNLLASTPAIRPCSGVVTSHFGPRRSPFTGMKEFHKGLDIANRQGTPIQATADGVVSFTGRKGAFGNMVVIDHGHGIVTRYAHVSKFLKKCGDKVKRGEAIARIGSTGRSTGPHVHYEVQINGTPVDPGQYILN